MENPDRLEAAHVRHENVDDHQIDAAAVERTKPRFAAIGHHHLEVVTFQKDLDGHADHRIVVDDENARHDMPQQCQPGCTAGESKPRLRNSAIKTAPCLPSEVYTRIIQPVEPATENASF